MECLNPPLSEVPVDEWFCPACAPMGVSAAADHVSEEEIAALVADVTPTTSRLRPHVRTRAIARTRQSERVRATVNRNRITTAQQIQHVPRYLMSSLLDETIEAVVAGLNTAIYQRPLAPRAPTRQKRKTGRRRKVGGKKRTQTKSSAGKKNSGTQQKRRKHLRKKRRGKKMRVRSHVKNEVTSRSRIARTLGLSKPVRGASLPSMYKPPEPSLGLMRSDIGAASLSVFGDPYELDPYESNEEVPANPDSPVSAKRRVLSQSALRSHRPVARPISVGLPRSSVPALSPDQEAEAAPVPDLLGSILSGQSFLMMSSSDVVINRDGSLTAKKAGMPFYKLQRAKEGAWKAEDLNQTLNQVYCQNIPLTPPLPSSLPPYAPVSQPTVQFIMQGSLPALGCMAGQSLTPEPGSLATASEPGIQAASVGNAEEKIKAPKPPVDKTKNEEYMKKLHMQERAVEEVKLAIKPFYQKREITKEEYKNILRKAVQKICHSKSGEINPMKVANLVKAYVEKYKHMRKHKKSDGEDPREVEN
ncbi:PREDICTED: PHD and RING finger domain-containing protein 1-like [Fulmarus glacialis]|uniref:PHD and RING finger domain-containing protein 1-like n=1 Tax=Fulmarus glacialis TaxID=30455 RepID=UPI00051C1FAB|nr:PREDICTED: PHD and RING finger domain-containing protein 1-like [Fulmarus glacialis]